MKLLAHVAVNAVLHGEVEGHKPERHQQQGIPGAGRKDCAIARFRRETGTTISHSFTNSILSCFNRF